MQCGLLLHKLKRMFCFLCLSNAVLFSMGSN
jgi:hypothetical protein